MFYLPTTVCSVQNRVPDWVAGELTSEMTTSLSSLQEPAPAVRSFEEVRERFNEAVGRSPNIYRYTMVFEL